MTDYLTVGFIMIVMVAAARFADYVLTVKRDREFKEYVDRIINPDFKDVEQLNEAAVWEEMEITKEAIQIAYQEDNIKKAEKLGRRLNALRAIKYKL